MIDYVNEIEFAVHGLIPILWSERNRLRALESKIEGLSAAVRANYEAAESIAMNAEDADDVMLATGRYWENYFGDDKELYAQDEERKKLVDEVAAHALSIGAVAGSLLQYAKQGISLVHGSLASGPNGRLVGSQPLKSVIWQGRNQAIHWEEGHPHAATEQSFETLKQDFGGRFNNYNTANMSVEVVDVLGWRDFKTFRDDMMSMA